MAFKLKEGRVGPTDLWPTPASTAIALGQPLKLVSGALAVVSSGDKVWYLARGTKSAGDSATTAIEVERVYKGKVYEGDIGTGTAGSTTPGADYDLKSGATSTVDLTATSNNDVQCVGWNGTDTAKADFVFLNTVF